MCNKQTKQPAVVFFLAFATNSSMDMWLRFGNHFAPQGSYSVISKIASKTGSLSKLSFSLVRGFLHAPLNFTPPSFRSADQPPSPQPPKSWALQLLREDTAGSHLGGSMARRLPKAQQKLDLQKPWQCRKCTFLNQKVHEDLSCFRKNLLEMNIFKNGVASCETRTAAPEHPSILWMCSLENQTNQNLPRHCGSHVFPAITGSAPSAPNCRIASEPFFFNDEMISQSSIVGGFNQPLGETY